MWVDDSCRNWLEVRGGSTRVVLFVDDGISEVLIAEFVEQECLFTYARV